jgi:hypothetical protein
LNLAAMRLNKLHRGTGVQYCLPARRLRYIYTHTCIYMRCRCAHALPLPRSIASLSSCDVAVLMLDGNEPVSCIFLRDSGSMFCCIVVVVQAHC